ncbi:MAG: radical SAM protein [Deltaproteobacteria bacterium]|nr:radical SAM protein [Deltaproteobacteria bacterium]
MILAKTTSPKLIMPSKKRAALVYTPSGMGPYDGELQTFHDHFGVLPSLSLGYVASIFEAAGWECRYFDVVPHGYTPATLVNDVRAFNPDLLCFSVYTYHFHENRYWIRLLKEATGKTTLVGGVHLGLYPQETFAYKELDFGLVGEAEANLPQFIEAFLNQSGWSEVPGLIWRDGEQLRLNAPPALPNEVDHCPNPARHLWPIEKYYTFVSTRRNFTPMITSRGCPFRCIFCEQGSKHFRAHSPQYVVEEMEKCIKEFGVKEIDMFDSSMTVNKKRIFEISELVQRKNLKVHWSARSRIDTVNYDVLKAMHDCGCYRIYFGIESGDEQVLKRLKKGVEIDRIRQTISDCKNIGIETLGFFMIGCPGDTLETARKTLKLSLELDLDFAQYNGVRALPGTELYDMVLPEQGEDFWREYIKDPKKSTFVARAQCNLSQEEINRLLRRFYLRFYFRPTYLIKRLARIRNLEELKKYSRAAIDMVVKG